jgi:P-type Ca2+ transporter type 2C
MTIRKLFSKGKFFTVDQAKKDPLPEFVHELMEYGILASKKDPFDPMDKALKSLGEHKLSDTEHLHDNWTLVHEYPLSRQLLALSNVWISPDGNEYIISAKGAPEAIADLCHFDKAKMDEMLAKVAEMAGEGLRVLGVARSSFKQNKDLPEILHDFPFEFIGLIGLDDPIRPTVPKSIEECYTAGIRVVMITGDYPQTAQNIAKQIGLANYDEVMTGPELDKMTPEELGEKVKKVNVFSRVVPEQKLLLVNALKKNGEVVAMTGDGVNDAPALKSAHIGVAMGERGTDVAREASDLVLTDDAFPSIVDAVRLGRRIFDNLKKAMAYIVSVHIPIAGMSLLPILLKWSEPVLFPVHIVFLELIIDPACSVVFEAEKEEKNIMNRKPRSAGEPLFGRRSMTISVIQGLVSLAIVFSVYLISMEFNKNILDQALRVSEARTLAFITLIVSNLALILTNRSWTHTVFTTMRIKNEALLFVLVGAVAFLLLVVYIPFLSKLFHFTFMHPRDLMVAFGAGILSILWFEVAKIFFRKRKIEIIKEK